MHSKNSTPTKIKNRTTKNLTSTSVPLLFDIIGFFIDYVVVFFVFPIASFIAFLSIFNTDNIEDK